MTLEILKKLIEWLCLWSVVWHVFYWLKTKKIDYVNRFHLACLYFLTVSFLLILVYYTEIKTIIPSDFSLLPFLFWLLLIAVNLSQYKNIKKHNQRPENLLAKHQNLYFLELDYRYLASKSLEIFCQQILIIILSVWLSSLELPLWSVVFLFMAIFGIGHSYLLISMGKRFGQFFLASSILSSIVFPVLILKVEYGFVYSYMVHSLFYLLSARYYWKNFD